ncbi:hypothetical protein PVMG_06152 [Plasmodium vivax Mauritania I]|uniref:Uncharacterized protein n=1 Tax=Plasmodium vivax Mauritania I TaxID=1035515 RepID=A0A0J9TKZ3_PLAVI|nr:hypothetical protein PVMG_06152 [Plasmodium vivax Mauritania I]
MIYPTIRYPEDDETAASDFYPLLKNLNLYEFYEELDKESSSIIYSDPKCDQCSNHIASEVSTGRELIALCKKVCNIILSNNDILGKCKDNIDNKPCQHMNYWLYNKIMSIIDNTSLVRNFYAAVNMYTHTHKHIFRNCTFTNFEIDKDKFKKKHILYKFLESYDDMKNKIDSQNELYTPLYCKRVKEYFNFYNLIKDNCTNDTCKHSEDLQNFKKKINKPEELTFIYEKCKYKSISCKHGTNGNDDVPCLGPQGNPLLFQIFGNDPDNIVNVLLNVAIISVPTLTIFLILFKDVHEQICPLNRFIRELENFNHNNQRFSTYDDLTDIVAENNKSLKDIGCAVYKGYTRLTAFDDENRRKFCDYLNLWLDEKKNTHTTVKSDIIIEKWVLIENLWDKLYEIEHPSRKCERQGKEKNASEIKKRMDLMVYCANRDYFKDLCKKDISWKSNVNQKCSLFNEFTNKNYTKFYNENECFDKAQDPQDYRYHISKECTLYNMSKTFPIFDSEQKAILDNDNIRTAIKKCVIHPEVEDKNTKQTGDVVDDRTKTSESRIALDESEDGLAESKFRHSEQEVDLPSPPVIVFPTSTDASLTDIGHSKSVYYAGLSVSGVFFTSMVLYKV